MPSSTASCTQRTASPSTARPCANHQKNPPSGASLTPTTPSEPLKPPKGAAVRDHRNAVRDQSESLSAINRNTCPQSPESAANAWRRDEPRNTSRPIAAPLDAQVELRSRNYASTVVSDQSCTDSDRSASARFRHRDAGELAAGPTKQSSTSCRRE